MNFDARPGSQANMTAMLSDRTGWEDLIEEAHRHVDKIRSRRRLPPWDWTTLQAKEGEMPQQGKPKSAEVAAAGLNTGADFARFMGALMADLVEGTIEPHVATAACKAGDKLLQVVAMQIKHGRESKDGTKHLQLTGGQE